MSSAANAPDIETAMQPANTSVISFCIVCPLERLNWRRQQRAARSLYCGRRMRVHGTGRGVVGGGDSLQKELRIAMT